jgi:hypothetical protein
VAYSVNTGNVSTADPTALTDIRSVAKAMSYLDQDNSQFVTMLQRMPEEQIAHYKHEWPEDQLLPQNTASSTTLSAIVNPIPITANEGLIARPGDVARILPTGEGVIITNVFASAWSVVRGFGGTAAATAASGAKIVIVGNMNEQNAAAPTAVITQRTISYNYSGIFRDVLDMAGTTEVLQYYGEEGGLFDSEKRKKLIEHKWRQERAAFFGARGYTTGANGKPWTSTGGLIEFIQTNRLDIGSTLTRPELQDTLRAALQYGNRSRKVMFCGPLVAQVIGSFLQDYWVQASPTDTVWGVKVDYVLSAAFAGKQIPVVVKGDWMRFGEDAARGYGSSGFIVDMDYVARLPLVRNGKNRDTHYRDHIQNPNVDGHAAEYLTEVAYRFANEKAHTYFYNVLIQG